MSRADGVARPRVSSTAAQCAAHAYCACRCASPSRCWSSCSFSRCSASWCCWTHLVPRIELVGMLSQRLVPAGSSAHRAVVSSRAFPIVPRHCSPCHRPWSCSCHSGSLVAWRNAHWVPRCCNCRLASCDWLVPSSIGSTEGAGYCPMAHCFGFRCRTRASASVWNDQRRRRA